MAAIAGSCALAAAPLAVTPIFAVDWVNHCWFAAYVAHVLVSDGIVPTFVNTNTFVGAPVLTFYGTALYVALAPFVWLFGAEAGMRVAVLAGVIAPALAVARLFLTLGIARLPTACLTICVSSSVYQLTNLYSRGAVTEFFACQLLLLGMALLLTFLSGDARASGAPLVFGTASLAVGALAHPPTFVTAGLFLGLPAVVLGVGLRRSIAASMRSRPSAWAIAASVVVPVALWLPIVVSQRAHLLVSQRASDFHYFPFSIDHWLARLWPAPIDMRVLTDGYNMVSTPFLAAPVNSIALALLVLVVVEIYRRRPADQRTSRALDGFVVAATVATVAPLLISLPLGPVEPSLAGDGSRIIGVVHAMPSSATARLLGSTQFAYRLVNVVNLAGILFLLGGCVLASRATRGWALSDPLSASWRYLLVAAATLSTAVVAIRVLDVHLEFSLLPRLGQQISPIANWKPSDVPRWVNGVRGWTSPTALAASRREIRDVNTIPLTQYGIGAYAMPTLHPPYVPSPEREEVVVAMKMTGHSTARAEARCSRPCVLWPNLFASSFASVTVDGKPARPDQLLTRSDVYIAIAAEQGTHTVEAKIGSRATTALAWAILWLVILFWTSALAALAGAFRQPRGPSGRPTTLGRAASHPA